MKCDNAKLDALRKMLANLMRENAAFEKASAESGRCDIADESRSRRLRIRMDQAAEHTERLMHECHCLAVEAGIADVRDDGYYGDKEQSCSTGWYRAAWHKRRPRV